MKPIAAFVFLTAACALMPSAANALVPGQVDTFQGGTTQGWGNGAIGGAVAPTVITSGGPGGAGDAFMQVTSTGSGPGGRLTVFNRLQWPGNYVAQGINAISIDLRNQSNITLTIRIAFKSSTASGAPGYLSQPFVINPMSGWQTALFQITPASMIPVDNPAPFSTFFTSGNVEMRIINAVNVDNLNGDFVAAQLGVDNIRAVPEPSAFALIGAGALGLLGVRFAGRRRTQR